MFWTGYRKYIYSSLLCFCIGCSNDNSNQIVNENNAKEQESELTEEQYAIRKIVNDLNISATEEYDIQIKYEYINPDTLQDILILLNRKEAALKHIKSNNSEQFFEKTGQTAPYNYVFVKLGGVKDLLSTTPIGSNVNYPLKATFLELTSKAYQDFYVDYRIRNSMQRNYYTVRNNEIYLTFSCPVFDSIGTKTPKVYAIEHLNSSVRIAKDIALYHAKIKDYNPDKIDDINSYNPKEIIKSDKLYVYFIFDEKTMKYKTPMKAPKQNE